jgi:uncharacterized protein (DUF111 family)
MLPSRVGYGAGHKELSVPNILRAVLGTAAGPATGGQEDGPDEREEVLLLECAVDDSTGELLGGLADALREAGALDVWMAPLVMKKGRPGVEISVLARPESAAALLDLLFFEGTTFGVRALPVSRYTLAREWLTVRVGGEEVRVKVGRRREKIMSVAPEFSEAAAAAGRLGRPVKDVYQEATEAARLILGHAPAFRPGGDEH